MERYTRQISLTEVGERGQELLAQASVLVVGVGGLGSPIATLLTSSGVGRIGLVEFDVVSLSNLPRQTLYTELEVGENKLDCAVNRLRAMNSTVQIEPHHLRLDESSARGIISRYDIVVDGTDNAETRYLIDAICAQERKPYIYGAIRGFEGQVSVFHHNGASGYAELFPVESLPEGRTAPPVMAVTPAIVGAIEANEVFKIIVGYGESLAGRLLTIDLRNYSMRILNI